MTVVRTSRRWRLAPAILALVVAAPLATACSGPAGADAAPGTGADAGTRVVHVAPDGSDGGSGSEGDPLRTPQAGVDLLGDGGGVVELADGTYVDQRVVLRGLTHVSLRAADGASPVLDASGLTPPRGESALVEVRGGDDVTVTGLELTGYRTTSSAKVPEGILVTGGAHDVTIADNHVHHLGNDNPTRGSFETNAHGIAVYGRSATRAIRGLQITGNEVDHLVLGASEAVVVNGNVDGWAVTDNYVHHNNNIGIDAIGYESGITGPDRWKDLNRARNGVISGNRVTDIVSRGNPSYFEDGQWCNCADGIYVDGGRSISIVDNVVQRADIGIEVAAENPRGRTNDVRVRRNTVRDSAYVGLAIGGYGPGRGEAYDVAVTGNTLRGNNTLDDGSAEILLQYKMHDTRITGNTVTATHADYPLLVQRLRTSGSTAQNADVVLDRNDYGAPVPASRVVFSWLGRERTGLDAWRRVSGQDADSTVSRR